MKRGKRGKRGIEMNKVLREFRNDFLEYSLARNLAKDRFG